MIFFSFTKEITNWINYKIAQVVQQGNNVHIISIKLNGL